MSRRYREGVLLFTLVVLIYVIAMSYVLGYAQLP